MRLNELRESYERQGFTPEEMVALMGVHTIQMARAEVEGFEGRWTKNPLVFDNSYYKEILSEKSKYLKLDADEELARVRIRKNRTQNCVHLWRDLQKMRKNSFENTGRRIRSFQKMVRKNY